MSLDFLREATRWGGPELLQGLRRAPRQIQFELAPARARHAVRLAKVSPLHALLAVLPDQPDCMRYFNAAYAQSPALALTWASYAVAAPPWSLAPWVETNRAALRRALIKEPGTPLSFAFQAGYRAVYDGSQGLALRQAFYAWLARRMPGLTGDVTTGTPSAKPVVGLLGESFHDQHVLKRTCQPEIDALRQAGYAVWLLQTGAQCRPVSGIDGVIPLLWDGQRLQRGEGPRLDALIFLEPFGTIVDAVGAGLRWAPLQLACGVTPTPVGSSAVDYWLQGDAARFPAEAPVQAVPGIGVTSAQGSPWRGAAANREGLVVASAPHKWSAVFLGWLQVLARAGVRLRFLPGGGVPTPVLRSVLGAVLPAKTWSLAEGLTHSAYLQEISQAQGMLDALPYGGLSTLVDAAQVGTPVFVPPGETGTQVLARGIGRHYGHGVPVASPEELLAELPHVTAAPFEGVPPPVTWLPALTALGIR